MKEIIKKDKNSNIIFFTPSIKETFDTCKRVTDDKLDLFCVEVYSGVSTEREGLAVSKDKYKISGKNGKLIIATGVAESSITFEDLTYVIDSGYELHGSYDPDIDAKLLIKERISQAQVKQRCGRSGRTEKWSLL